MAWRLSAAAIALAVAVVAVVPAEAAPAAPAFRVTLLDRAEVVDSREHFGERVIVLRFQASWCKRCVAESAALSRVADRYRSRGVQIVALHVQDTAADARRFVRRYKPTYVIALDPKLTIGNRFGFKGTPYTVVIDRKGEMVAQLHGESVVSRLSRILDEVLADSPPPAR
ncbi:MAG TPA: TlpA disulfide reductase family protein [Methylomirabilota bacterium]|jgi:thiol-disulfide isomerase/thioredoxin